jgi:hypothetical protein
MPYKGYLRGVKVINVTEGIFFWGEWGEILVPLLWGGVPRRGGVVGATQNHPVRLRLTPLQRRGMDLGPLQRGGFMLLSRLRGQWALASYSPIAA